MLSVCFNGDMIPANQPILSAANRGYRYGETLFETMRWHNDNLPLGPNHFGRLFFGLEILQIPKPPGLDYDLVDSKIRELCIRNGCAREARVRLTVSGGSGGLFTFGENSIYIIECEPPGPKPGEEESLIIDIYPGARKSCDLFSNLKSSGFLPYLMSAKYAKSKGLDDCLVLNTKERIADSTISNLFIRKDNKIITPSLDEGCVAGVMRQFLIDKIRQQNDHWVMIEKGISVEEIEKADEVFLTNAFRGTRRVGQFRNVIYKEKEAFDHCSRIVKTIFS